MRKMISLILLTTFLLLSVGCSCSQQTVIGEVNESKDDEAAIKEVVEAFYQANKNFDWQKIEPKAGLEYWTAEDGERFLEEEANSWVEFVKTQKFSSKLKGLDFEEIKIEENEASVEVVSREEFTSEEDENLDGIFRGFGFLKLHKNEQLWQIVDYDFHFVKIEA